MITLNAFCNSVKAFSQEDPLLEPVALRFTNICALQK